MELNQLYCFLKVAQLEHMTRAAEQLHITQPALSKNIARLEEDLGVQLFDRQGKNIFLNEYGQVALRYTKQVLYALEDLRAELDEMARAQAGHIRVGSAFPAQEPNFLLSAIRSFALDRPDMKISLFQHAARDLPALLEEREIDVGVTASPIHNPGILWHQLFCERMGIILSADHPLAQHESLSLLDLQMERFYCNNSNSDVHDLTLRFCHQAGFEPTIHFEGDFPSFIGEAISLGYGVSIISQQGYLRSQSRSGDPHAKWENKIVFRPLREAYCQRICGIARLASRSEKSTVGVFYDFLREQCREDLLS
ncbi:MAG: LysR family transcriptional regulator [Oscillospiraceae bacterium]|nr:LysR family transcriptional regulator [Oscillospiraceae bacterium]